MKYELIIKNGTIITSYEKYIGNIAVKDGKIAIISKEEIVETADCVIDASGLLIFPGFIDTHAHLNDPGYNWREDYEHGTAAACVGGYTTIIDMPLQNNPTTSDVKYVEDKINIVSPHAYVDFCLWGGLLKDNMDDLEAMHDRGCVAFKSFLGPVSPDYQSLSYGQAYNAMEKIAKFGGMAGFHCEDYSIISEREKMMKNNGENSWQAFLDSRPESAEIIAVDACIEMAKETGCRVHICHVSSPIAASHIKKAKDEGILITAETCAHYLTMTTDDLFIKGELCKCAPPLKTKEQVDELWKYVEDGTFDGIASDHSPCTYEEKYTELLGKKIETVFDVWGGISGIQSCVQATFSEGCVKRKIPYEVIAKVMAENPAKAFDIYGTKGDIKEGFDADFTIIDPNKEWTIEADDLLYVNKISAFVGMTGTGCPAYVIVRGNIVSEDGNVTDIPCVGKFISHN